MTSPPAAQIYSLAIDEQDGQTWVIATGQLNAGDFGLWVSNDAGRSWRGISTGSFTWESVRSGPSAIFATDYRTTGGLLVTRDQGQSWSTALAGTANETAFETAVPSRVRPGLLLAARRPIGSVRPDSIYRSMNDGTTWSDIPIDGASRSRGVFSIVEDASGVLLAAVSGGGGNPSLLRSTDQGASWQSLSTPFWPQGLQSDPARARTYVRTGGVRATDNAGQTWSALSGNISSIRGIGVSPATGDLFAADLRTGVGSILISEGGTGPLRQVGQSMPAALSALATDKCGSILVAGGFDTSNVSSSLYSSPIPRNP